MTGAIPPELSKLSALKRLDLYHNELTGQVPTELVNLPNLTYLNLSENELTGEVPAELAGFANLRELDLHFNELTGVIPPRARRPLQPDPPVARRQRVGAARFPPNWATCPT